jgi:hypothetical protein
LEITSKTTVFFCMGCINNINDHTHIIITMSSGSSRKVLYLGPKTNKKNKRVQPGQEV